MNRLHRWYCRTGHWARTVERDLLDWTVGEAWLGDDLLELGAGSGTVTKHLRRTTTRLTAADLDGEALSLLRTRLTPAEGATAATGQPAGHVRAVCADATALPFAASAFSSVATFAMLHHIGGADRQRALLAEVRRVLRPGGLFVGCDVVWTLGLRLFHVCDTFAPVDPDRWTVELASAGFDRVDIATAGSYMRWHASAARMV